MIKALKQTKWQNWIPILPIFVFKWSISKYFIETSYLDDNDPYKTKCVLVFVIWLIYQFIACTILFFPLLMKLQ